MASILESVLLGATAGIGEGISAKKAAQAEKDKIAYEMVMKADLEGKLQEARYAKEKEMRLAIEAAKKAENSLSSQGQMQQFKDFMSQYVSSSGDSTQDITPGEAMGMYGGFMEGKMGQVGNTMQEREKRLRDQEKSMVAADSYYLDTRAKLSKETGLYHPSTPIEVSPIPEVKNKLKSSYDSLGDALYNNLKRDTQGKVAQDNLASAVDTIMADVIKLTAPAKQAARTKGETDYTSPNFIPQVSQEEYRNTAIELNQYLNNNPKIKQRIQQVNPELVEFVDTLGDKYGASSVLDNSSAEDAVMPNPNPVLTPSFTSKEDVRAVFREGKISREEAKKIISERFSQ